MKSSYMFLFAVAACSAGSAWAQGQFSVPGCANVQESDFQWETLVGRSSAGAPGAVSAALNQPLKLALDMLPDSSVDVYFVSRGALPSGSENGPVKKYNTKSKILITVGTVPSGTGGEGGLVGIALDPAFKNNHFIYLHYTGSGNHVISRIRLNAAHTQFEGNNYATTEKRLMVFPYSGQNHTGSGMSFDAHGDLWIPIGKDGADYPQGYSLTAVNNSSEKSSANSADYRGGILRIHPDTTVAKGYTIPAGNYGEYFGNYFQARGMDTLAIQYRDTSKVKPEIYVKGSRNPYTITVHPTKRWMTTGVFGVNTTLTWTEEQQLLTKPAFVGYPYYQGGGVSGGVRHQPLALWNNTTNADGRANWRVSYGTTATQNDTLPRNNSTYNTGVKTLPPIAHFSYTYRHTLNSSDRNGGGAITGPIYQYDTTKPSAAGRFPRQFHDAWFITDFIQETTGATNNPPYEGFRGIKILKLNAAGDSITDSLSWFKNFPMLRSPLDMQQGPDGALYIVNFHYSLTGSARGMGDTTNISRLVYKGPTCNVPVSLNGSSSRAHESIARMNGGRLEIREGSYSLVVRDVSGREVFRDRGAAPRSYATPELSGNARGLLVVSVKTARGTGVYRMFRN